MGKIWAWIYFHLPIPIRFRLTLVTRFDTKLCLYIRDLVKQFHDSKRILEALIDKSDSETYTKGLLSVYRDHQEKFKDIDLEYCFPRVNHYGDKEIDPAFFNKMVEMIKPQIIQLTSERKFECMKKSKWCKLFITYKYNADGLVTEVEDWINVLDNISIEWIGKLIPVWENEHTYKGADYMAKSIQELIQVREDLIKMLHQERKDLKEQIRSEIQFLSYKQRKDIKQLLTTI